MKADELRELDALIALLGPQSYLGPWLSQYRPSIEMDIRGDRYPLAPSPLDAYQIAAATVEDAKAEAARLVEAAKAEADKIRRTALDDALDTARRLRGAAAMHTCGGARAASTP